LSFWCQQAACAIKVIEIWPINESARLKVEVKRALRKYGYPPDLEQLATETVLAQAELLAEL
jgi:type I restriction enzyme R subunit